MLSRVWSTYSILGVLASSLAGCHVSVNDGHGSYEATITVEWSVDGSQRASACADYDVDYAHITIDNPHGFFYEVDVPCEDFGIDIDLPADRYQISVQLFDSGDHRLTEEALTDELNLFEGDVENVLLDFPDRSFI